MSAAGTSHYKKAMTGKDQESTSEPEQDMDVVDVKKRKTDENALDSMRLRKVAEASVKKRGRSIPPRHPNELGKTRPPSEHEQRPAENGSVVMRKHKTRKEHPVNRVMVAMTMDPTARR